MYTSSKFSLGNTFHLCIITIPCGYLPSRVVGVIYFDVQSFICLGRYIYHQWGDEGSIRGAWKGRDTADAYTIPHTTIWEVWTSPKYSRCIILELLPTLRSENLADISTECFSHHQGVWCLMMTEAFSRNISKVFRSQSWHQRTLFYIYAWANSEKQPLWI